MSITKFSFYLLGILLLLNGRECAPIVNLIVPVTPFNPTWVLSNSSEDCSTDDIITDGPNIQHNGLINPNSRWSLFNVFIDPTFDSYERSLIEDAMRTLARVIPCVQFGIYRGFGRPRGDYVHIRKLRGCSSPVGRIGGAQVLSLGGTCSKSREIILHELLHALGLYHEQSRPDRDDYVTIHWENIRPGKENNFKKQGYDTVSTFGVRYNRRSIMHYNSKAFSRNGRPTITAKNGGFVGPSQTLQQTDIEKLQRMYGCR